MTGYSHGNEYSGFRKVYADKYYASIIGQAGTFGFEIGLADRLSKAFPDENTYIVKYAFGGASLDYDWISPSTPYEPITNAIVEGEEKGWLYNGLVESLTDAIETLSSTTNTIPMVEAFMWMQGESDSSFNEATERYLNSFNTMIYDFTTTFKDNLSYKFAVYDAAINEISMWPNAVQINDIKKSRVDDKNVYIETNNRITTNFEPIGTSTDAAHYDAACYIDLGHMFADAYLGKTIRGYSHDAIEIDAPEKLTLTMGEDYTIQTPKVYFNGEEIDNAKMSYFAMQHVGFNNTVSSYFVVNDDNTITPLKVGESKFRITAYYNNEVRTVVIPAEVVAR